MAAVIRAEYRDRMEQQRQRVERPLNSTVNAFAPESRLHLTQTALKSWSAIPWR
jgi:hypothetical protein